MSVNPAGEIPFLTVAEVAELLRLNQQTVRNWIDAGSLPAVRIGRRVRIKREDFDRIVESGYGGGSQQAQAAATPAGPSADDFWGGEPVGDAITQMPTNGAGSLTQPHATAGAGSDAPAQTEQVAQREERVRPVSAGVQAPAHPHTARIDNG